MSEEEFLEELASLLAEYIKSTNEQEELDESKQTEIPEVDIAG